MPAAIKDYTGFKFGKLTAICNTYTKLSNRRTFVWEFLCDCGEKVLRDVSIVHQHNKIGCTPSCELCRKAKTSEISTTHGDSKCWLYSRWNGIKKRCYDTNNIDYSNYGGRGISLSEEFEDYIKFSEYMRTLDGYSEHNTIDRIDPNGNYERGNLRWATYKQQSQNRQFNKRESELPVGVCYRKNGFYRAQWVHRDGKKKEKSFSIKRFGEELSRFLAEEYRSLMIERLNCFGESYSEFHGKFKGEQR